MDYAVTFGIDERAIRDLIEKIKNQCKIIALYDDEDKIVQTEIGVAMGYSYRNDNTIEIKHCLRESDRNMYADKMKNI